ncbi:IS110 family transposase, partial [Paenibacillus sp. GCM10027630]
FLATLQLIGINPVFRELHEYNIKVKHMKKQRSVFKLLGKVARILISIVQRGETFSPEKASHILIQAA